MCTPTPMPNTSMKLKATAKLKPTPRPYTTYNIFFQLEREYILQHDFNVTPDFRPEETFSCSDKNYEGPALPSKYQDIVLPDDWYVPGKAIRKKRQHRASHRKISFIDLSKKISSSWRGCGDEVKLFCAQVSNIGMMKYKQEMRQYNKKSSTVAIKTKPSKPKKKLSSKPQPGTSACASASASANSITPETCPQAIGPSLLRTQVNHSSLSVAHSLLLMNTSNKSHRSHIPHSNNVGLVDNAARTPTLCPECSSQNVLGEVEMEDNEILKIWTAYKFDEKNYQN